MGKNAQKTVFYTLLYVVLALLIGACAEPVNVSALMDDDRVHNIVDGGGSGGGSGPGTGSFVITLMVRNTIGTVASGPVREKETVTLNISYPLGTSIGTLTVMSSGTNVGGPPVISANTATVSINTSLFPHFVSSATPYVLSVIMTDGSGIPWSAQVNLTVLDPT